MAVTTSATLIAATGRLASSEGLIWLLEIPQAVLGSTWRLAFWNENVVYDPNDLLGSRTYEAVAGSIEEYTEEDGSLARWAVTLSNVTRLAQAKLEEQYLQRQRVRLLAVDAANLTVAGHHREFQFFLMEATADPERVTLMVGPGHLMHVLFPKNRFLRDKCEHVFKGPRCGYVGGETTCDKTYAGTGGCLGRANQARYGAYPHMLRQHDPLLG